MNNNLKKAGLILAAVSIAVCATSCGKKDDVADDSNSVTWWCSMSGNESQIVSNRSDTEFGKALSEATGVNVKFEHPSGGNASEKFNVMVAMGKLPDIVEYDWTNGYNGGAEKAMENGLITELDLKNDAPNLAAYIAENPDLDKWIKTDSGKYWGYPMIRGDRYLLTSAGIFIRQDWLNELGLEAPETMDEWTNVLRAFKAKGVDSPLALTSWAINLGAFIGAYDTFDGLYVRDGKVCYGPMEDSYKDFLTQINDWYNEGLIDQDYASIDNNIIQSKMLNNQTGATFGACGSMLGKWLSSGTGDFDLVGTKYPTLVKGQRPEFGHCDPQVLVGDMSVISAKSKKIDLAKKVLDYGYSEEGRMLYNFGVEGKSYNMVDGYPTFTDEIMHNPDGLAVGVAMSNWAQSQNGGPFVQDKRYMEQYASMPQQQAALDTWSDTNALEHIMPKLMLTKEQQNELATLLDTLNTRADEWQTKFIMGIEPMSNFETYRNELRELGVDKYIEYMQEAYDRFLAR